MTITYGTASAPYLATRTLQQLALEDNGSLKRAAEATMIDFYVDDILTGADTFEEAQELQNQLMKLLSKGGFLLRKWCSNDEQLLQHLSPNDKESAFTYNLSDDHTIKTLGIFWNSQTDTFKYSINLNSNSPSVISKRIILSEASRLFDPLGLVSPVILKAKILLQEIWRLNLTWDESVPIHIQSAWIKFRQSLYRLNDLNIPRRIQENKENTKRSNFQLHTFSDASERGYGACVYLRQVDDHQSVKVTLVCYKTRVAPIKTVTLPRLELCGALLAAELAEKTIQALKLEILEKYYWTDSTIVLSWLHSCHTNWNIFVSNRVRKIQNLSEPSTWHHVKGSDNPADIASRGISADDIVNKILWWEGPQWLSESSAWKSTENFRLLPDDELPEYKPKANPVFQTVTDKHFIYNYSSITKIIRIVAYLLRFCYNSRIKEPKERNTGYLKAEELNQALHSILKIIQNEHFNSELKQLKNNQPLAANSKLVSLCPFLDEHELIRVGGRLQQSNLSHDHKHPIVLPPKNTITTLLFRDQHIKLLHAGAQALLANMRLKFWPLHGRRLARKTISNCLICCKARPRLCEQQMGPLPSVRIQSARPFIHVGIDFCGPVSIISSHRRRAKSTKGYISVFVCMATKAIHLELVQELTTKAFIAALQRFTSRRGKCQQIYCDNAKNFVGAKNELSKFHSLLTSQTHLEILANENIKWNFIPPRSPHFGGLWEAGVKSVKNHLVRVLKETNLTYDELYTVLCRIEGWLNSRSLNPLSSDPSDLSYLSPKHFLVGQPLTAIPEEEVEKYPTYVSRWRRMNQITQHFWNRWRKEYLSELQIRVKWRKPHANVKPGLLVLIQEDNVPPMKWKLGRITKTITGPDGKVRVVLIQTSHQVIKRSISKICPLPVEDPSSASSIEK